MEVQLLTTVAVYNLIVFTQIDTKLIKIITVGKLLSLNLNLTMCIIETDSTQ